MCQDCVAGELWYEATWKMKFQAGNCIWSIGTIIFLKNQILHQALLWNLLSRCSCILGLLSSGHYSSLTGNILYWNCVSCISSFYQRLKPQSCSVLIPAAEVSVRCGLTNKLHIMQSSQPWHPRLMKISQFNLCTSLSQWKMDCNTTSLGF